MWSKDSPFFFSEIFITFFFKAWGDLKSVGFVKKKVVSLFLFRFSRNSLFFFLESKRRGEAYLAGITFKKTRCPYVAVG